MSEEEIKNQINNGFGFIDLDDGNFISLSERKIYDKKGFYLCDVEIKTRTDKDGCHVSVIPIKNDV